MPGAWVGKLLWLVRNTGVKFHSRTTDAAHEAVSSEKKLSHNQDIPDVGHICV